MTTASASYNRLSMAKPSGYMIAAGNLNLKALNPGEPQIALSTRGPRSFAANVPGSTRQQWGISLLKAALRKHSPGLLRIITEDLKKISPAK